MSIEIGRFRLALIIGGVATAVSLVACSTPAATVTPTATRAEQPTPTVVVATPTMPAPTATPTVTPEPTSEPSPTPTVTPTVEPTATPTPVDLSSPPLAVFTSPSTGIIGSLVRIEYTLFDQQSDRGEISASYSADGGVTFFDATIAADSEPTTRVATRPISGYEHFFLWDVATDLGRRNFVDNVRFRITPSDSSDVGEPITTELFAYIPTKDTVTEACGVTEDQWETVYADWDALRGILDTCTRQAISSFKESLDVLENALDDYRDRMRDIPEPDPTAAEPQADVDAIAAVVPDAVTPLWDHYLTLRGHSDALRKAAVTAAGNYPDTATMNSEKSNIINASGDLRRELESISRNADAATLTARVQDHALSRAIELLNEDIQIILQQKLLTVETIGGALSAMHDAAMAVIRNKAA